MAPSWKKRKALGADQPKTETEDDMNNVAYEQDDKNEPEVIFDADEFMNKLEKRKKENLKECEEIEPIRKEFNWDQFRQLVPDDIKGIALIGIASMACIISTVLTVELVTSVRGSSGAITLGLGLMWELSKYTFGSISILHPDQKMKTVLGWCTAILIFGSVAASLGYLTEMSDLVQENKMVESVEYQDLASERATLQSQMDTLLLSASEDTKRSYRKRALETNAKIEPLRERYVDLGEDMTKLKQTKVQLNTFNAVASLIIALMLELCGILAISLFAQNKEKQFA
jgi:hypothetical protein